MTTRGKLKRPSVIIPVVGMTELELLSRVWVAPWGCYLWTGATSGTEGAGAGYGKILIPGTRVLAMAHRYVYTQFKGPIPMGQQVDHICRHWTIYDLDPILARLCVRPEHLECCSQSENLQRASMARAASLLRAEAEPEYRYSSNHFDPMAGLE